MRRIATTLHRDGSSKNTILLRLASCNPQWCGVTAQVTEVGRHPGSVTMTVATLCQVSSLKPPHHDTHSTPRETHHAFRVLLTSVFAVLARRAMYLPSCLLNRFVSSVSGSVGRFSKKPKSMRCFLFAPYPVVLQANSTCRGSSSPLTWKNFEVPQPHGKQAAAPLKSSDPLLH